MVKFFKSRGNVSIYYAIDNGYYIPLCTGFNEFEFNMENRVFSLPLGEWEEWCSRDEVLKCTTLAPWAKKYLYKVKRHVVEGKLP